MVVINRVQTIILMAILSLFAPMQRRFVADQKGTPSIETVAIVALVALAIFSNLESLGQAVSNIFGSLTSKLNSSIN